MPWPAPAPGCGLASFGISGLPTIRNEGVAGGVARHMLAVGSRPVDDDQASPPIMAARLEDVSSRPYGVRRWRSQTVVPEEVSPVPETLTERSQRFEDDVL